MYGLKDLKPQLQELPGRKVECPVSGCSTVVERQTSRDLERKPKFYCDKDKIYISPSTFEYESDESNVLWDYKLLMEHMAVKRESRIARDNSEDAVTWNVFRFLENKGLLADCLSSVTGSPQTNPETFFWSYNKKTKNDYDLLNEARLKFGETIKRGSEPDLMVLTNEALIFIEAKLSATNKTKPSSPDNKKKYDTADDWFSKVFKPSVTFKGLAVDKEKYELMRFWLIGSWMANELKRKFYLLNLVRDESEQNIESVFGIDLIQDASKQFKRITWEGIYQFVAGTSQDKARLLDYMKNKTIGYRQGQLVKAFIAV